MNLVLTPEEKTYKLDTISIFFFSLGPSDKGFYAIF